MSKLESRARRWLRLDAFYCAGGGLLAVVLAAPLARLLQAPREVLVAAGVGALAWAWILTRLARRQDWRRPLQLVAAANAAASAGIAVLAALVGDTAGRLLLVAVCVEVGAFAAVQVRTLLPARD